MTGPERYDVIGLMRRFRSGEAELGRALALFAEREDLGFVWLAYREDALVGCCSVSYAISTSAGGVVAVVRDLYVDPAARRTGVARALIDALDARLAGAEIAALAVATGIDTSVAAFASARGMKLEGALFTTAS